MILAIDQGTTGTTCLVVDEELRTMGRGYREIRQYFPRPGWVEHDPEEIWDSVLATARDALAQAAVSPRDLRAIGITNQRETTVLWERSTGRPLQRAIVWQDRRTAERCRELPGELIRERTGLVADPYFSATKLEWMLAACERNASELAFGTVDSWLVWRLTGGEVHATDVTNASRTMLMNLAKLAWDDELLDLFGVDRSLLPTICRSSELIGESAVFGVSVPIAAIAGDQQASLFGHACFAPGEAKATYGTGSFVLANIGDSSTPAPRGLLKTAAAFLGDDVQYAVEGAVLASGAAIQWLRDGLGLLADAAESERLALETASTEGVYFVPALTGLGSPYWDPDARGLVSGLTRGTTRAHLVRAALEAIAHQVADILDELPIDAGVLRADGGAADNGFLMQFQSDILRLPVEVADERETTALGAAGLAGLAVGFWSGGASVASRIVQRARYEPAMAETEARQRREEWRAAVRRTLLR